MKIGFIGLGSMGWPMAQNLLAADHDVQAFDTSPKAVKAAADAGMTAAPSAEEAVRGASAAILMLPNADSVQSVVRQILPAMQPGALLIDCSTIDVASSRAVHEAAASSELLCLDAPVSGGVGGASAGTLTFMIGGSKKA